MHILYNLLCHLHDTHHATNTGKFTNTCMMP